MNFYSNHQFYDRFKMIISDPCNAFITKLPHSGILNGNTIKMYNGLYVFKDSYYGSFSDILLLNEGVHEPSEEWVFNDIIKKYKNKAPVMVELGSYWAFYSMTLKMLCNEAIIYCIEAGKEELEWGMKNFSENLMVGNFIQSFVGNNGINLTDFYNEKGLKQIDILHCDIQGFEMEMLLGAKDLFLQKNIEYAFISTHSNALHYDCINTLQKYEYRIIAEVSFAETLCEDGIIVAVNNNMVCENYSLPKKSQTNIIGNDVMERLLKTKL